MLSLYKPNVIYVVRELMKTWLERQRNITVL